MICALPVRECRCRPTAIMWPMIRRVPNPAGSRLPDGPRPVTGADVARRFQNWTLAPNRTVRGVDHRLGTPKAPPDLSVTRVAKPRLVALSRSTYKDAVEPPTRTGCSRRKSRLLVAPRRLTPRGSMRMVLIPLREIADRREAAPRLARQIQVGDGQRRVETRKAPKALTLISCGKS